MRGSYPFDINNNDAAAGTYDWVTTLAAGIPAVKLPDTVVGQGRPAEGRLYPLANPNMVNRGRIQQWNVAVERRLPLDIALEVAYVGTATDGGYADLNLNVGVPGGGGSAAKYYARGRHDGHQRLGRADEEPVQGPAGGPEPAVQEWPDAQGRLHLEPDQELAPTRTDGPDSPGTTCRSTTTTSRSPASTGRTSPASAGSTSCRSSRTARTPWATILGGWQVNGVWRPGSPARPTASAAPTTPWPARGADRS